MKRLVIIGASGHGKVVADIAARFYDDILFLDDGVHQKCLDYPVVGKSSDFAPYIDNSDFFVAIGNAKIRRKVTEMLVEHNAHMATLVHPNSTVAKDVLIGEGTVVMAGAVLNPGVRLGKGCIINTCSSVDHDCLISDYVHVAVGAHLAGNVIVGSGTWIGAGATVSNNLTITKDCMVGAGAVVVSDLLDADTYICVPARKMSEIKG